ncbi:MAG: cyclic-phosphate processing receiver domain-containing protein [Planctomycetota bacterium]
MSDGTKLWLDDLRPAPAGWVWVKSAWDAIDALRAGGVVEISLDHDLAGPEDGTGYDVVEWIAAEAFHGRLAPLRWATHTANPLGAERMELQLERAERSWARHRSEGEQPS